MRTRYQIRLPTARRKPLLPLVNQGSTSAGNRIVRHYDEAGRFVDLTIDQTISQGLNQWKNWECSAGVSYVYVDPDGEVYRGTCRVGGSLGNVYTDFELPDSWVRCTEDCCGCGSEVMLEKARNANLARWLGSTSRRSFSGESSRREQLGRLCAVEAVPAVLEEARYRVQWDIGRRCNYHCSYCWPGVHSHSEPLKEPERLLSAARKLTERFGRGRRVAFQFAGGEPTVQPKFLELVQFIHGRGHRCTVTTNGSRSANYLADLIEHALIVISVHFEFADLDGLLEKIRTMMLRIGQDEKRKRLEVKLMSPPGTLEMARAFRLRLQQIEKFERFGSWSYVPIRNSSTEQGKASELVSYSARELRVIQERM